MMTMTVARRTRLLHLLFAILLSSREVHSDDTTTLRKGPNRGRKHGGDRGRGGAAATTTTQMATSIATTSAATVTAPDPDDEDATAKIIGGVDAINQFRYPYYSLLWKDSLCGGALIAPDIVLSAAHCKNAANEVKVNFYSRFSNEDPSETIRIKKKIVHSDYDRNKFPNDIMVLVLDKKSTKLPIKINQEDDVPESSDLSMTAIGFGDTDKVPGSDNIRIPFYLQEASGLAYVNNDQCDRMFASNEITDDMLCALAEDKDSCGGDSGGPLIIPGDTTANDLLVGLVSWGKGCADERWPGVYVRISYFYDWIVEEVCLNSKDIPSYMDCPDRGPARDEATDAPTNMPTRTPTMVATGSPSLRPSVSSSPSFRPSRSPSASPSVAPTDHPTASAKPSQSPSLSMQPSASSKPTTSQSPSESPSLSQQPSVSRNPTSIPTPSPTILPSSSPSLPIGDTVFVGWFQPQNLGHCHGDCNLDSDCADGLVCFRRRRGETIPGCTNDEELQLPRGADFCIREEDQEHGER